MNSHQDHPNLHRFVEKYREPMQKAEWIVVPAFLLAIALQILNIFGLQFVSYGLGMLSAIIYTFHSYGPNMLAIGNEAAKNFNWGLTNFVNKLTFIAFSIGCIGVIFDSSSMKGGDLMLLVSLLTLTICFIFVLYLKIKDQIIICPKLYIIRLLLGIVVVALSLVA